MPKRLPPDKQTPSTPKTPKFTIHHLPTAVHDTIYATSLTVQIDKASLPVRLLENLMLPVPYQWRKDILGAKYTTLYIFEDFKEIFLILI